jgi:hypothetical protein
MKRIAAVVLLAAFGAASAYATCEFQVTSRLNGDRINLTWNPVPGATHYRVFETLDYSGQQQRLGVSRGVVMTRFEVRRKVIEQTNVNYLVYAENPNDPAFAACIGSTDIQLQPDEELVRQSRRLIVPLVGSTAGANGARFKTSLRIRPLAGRRGTIYFRPVGTTPNAADPSLRYEFGASSPEVYYDDVVAAMGASGVGSLELVPDATSWSDIQVDVRVYNETPNGTFGSSQPAVTPYDWLYYRDSVSAGGSLDVPTTTAQFRRNIGFRTITPVLYRATIIRRDGHTLSTEPRSFPADYTFFGTLDQFVGTLPGFEVRHDERVILAIISGYAIPFYTTTENVTNDPTIFVRMPTPHEPRDVFIP